MLNAMERGMLPVVSVRSYCCVSTSVTTFAELHDLLG